MSLKKNSPTTIIMAAMAVYIQLQPLIGADAGCISSEAEDVYDESGRKLIDLPEHTTMNLEVEKYLLHFSNEEIEKLIGILPSAEYMGKTSESYGSIQVRQSAQKELRQRLKTLKNIQLYGTFLAPGEVSEDCQIRMSLDEYVENLKSAFPEPRAACYSAVLEVMGLSLEYHTIYFKRILGQIRTALENSGPTKCYHPFTISQLIKAILVRNAMFMYSEWPYPETVDGYINAYGKISCAIPYKGMLPE